MEQAHSGSGMDVRKRRFRMDGSGVRLQDRGFRIDGSG